MMDVIDDEEEEEVTKKSQPRTDTFPVVSVPVLSENIISSLIQQMLCAVSYCHDNNVAHREINPECLFFDGSGEVPIVKIMNYGTFYLKPSVENSFYTAPEIVNNKNCDEKCDV